MSYALFWILYFPRPFHSSKRLKQLLDPRPGERVLEIGPGIGLSALHIANALAPDGVLDVLDIQEEMIMHLERRAVRAGVTNIVATQADAKEVPYADDTFDGVYLVTTLGEISDKDAALREIRRVLKPSGRLIIGEFFLDPDFQRLGETRERLNGVGFTFDCKTGFAWSYLARFDPK
jgi:ubiquinone/menaquinone biosynthesis C-methylase UbiE